jgi:hypothetical protein
LGILKTGDGGGCKAPTAPISSIRLAETGEELLQIGRLRYALFVERDGKPYRHADPARRVFLEPIDDCSLNFFATIGNDCVAAVRLTRALDTPCDGQLSRLGGAVRAFRYTT